MASPQTSGPALPPGLTREQVSAARIAVFVVFALNGATFATWASRIPTLRDTLELTPGRLGLLLLFISLGSVTALPVSGAIVSRIGATATVRWAGLVATAGMAWAAFAAAVLGSVPFTGLGMVALGLGIGTWDVAMNFEGGGVERWWGRTVMPHFHAAFSAGTVVSALIGAGLSRLGVGLVPHLVGGAILIAAANWWGASRFLPPVGEVAEEHADQDGGVGSFNAWTDPKTLLIGLFTLVAGLTEGTANDWMSVAMVDGHHLPEWAGVLGFATFLTFMTVGRLAGTSLLDRFGRVPVLLVLLPVALVGSLLVVFGSTPLAYIGAALWGFGVALGFPVGMSAASDDPRYAAKRLSVVCTIAYTAFLAGPPLLGFLGDHWGILRALLVVGAVLVPALFLVPIVREPRRD